MNECDVIVDGFPSSMTNMKVKIFIEKKIGSGTLKKVERNEGKIYLAFKDLNGMQKFTDANLTVVTFGNETYGLSYQYNNASADVRQKRQPATEAFHGERRKLHVYNIPRRLSLYNNFRYHFQRYGDLETCELSESGHGFVKYRDHDDAVWAVRTGRETESRDGMLIEWADEEVDITLRQQTSDFRRHNPSFHSLSSPAPPSGINHTQFQNKRSYDPNMGPTLHAGDGSPRNPRTARPSSSNNFRGRQGALSQHGTTQGSIPLHGSNPSIESVGGSSKQGVKSAKTTRKSSSVIKDAEDKQSLYQNTHFWTDLQRLPAEGGTQCILAQNIAPTTHLQAVKMHFESNKRSGGGTVKSIIKMNDGLLITFENQKDSVSCADTPNQEMENEKLKIFTKVVPTYYSRKFVITGVSEVTSVDVLKMFLERCTVDEITPSVCKKQSIPGVYLIEYSDHELDGIDINDFLSKISADPLEDHRLQGFQLLHSDCLRVKSAPPTASDDEIRFVFESKRRTDGGPVTRIDRIKSGDLLVYFANFADAERIYNRFKQPCVEVIVIAEKPVVVELYYHSLSKDHEGVIERKVVKPTPRSQPSEGVVTIPGGIAGRPVAIQLKPLCEERIFLLIKESKNHFGDLMENVKDLGRVELSHAANDGCIVKFIPNKNIRGEGAYGQQCKDRFQAFISRFVTKTKTFDKEQLVKARSLKLHPALETESAKDRNGDFMIRWKEDHVTVEISGLEDVVKKLLIEIEEAVGCNTVTIPIDEEGYRVMIHCGIIGELKHKYDKVKIHCDDKASTIAISGPEKYLHQIQIEALSLRTMVKETKITELDECAVQYLLRNGESSQNMIQKCIFNSNIKAEFAIDSEDLFIRARNKGEHRKAMNIIRDMIALEILPVTGGRANVVKTNAWKKFQQEMANRGSQGLYLRPDNTIVMVGMQSEVRTLRTKVDTFLNENEIRRDYIQMAFGKARFILERCQMFSASTPVRKAVKCGLTPEYGGGIFTEGIKQNLDAARREVNNILARVVEQQHTLRDPGIKSYYLGTDGQEFLEATSRVNNCVILLHSPFCEEWVRYAREHQNVAALNRAKNSSKMVSGEENLIAVDRDGVTLTVWKTDIIKHRCDAIVNASNKELALLSGGVSGVIKDYDRKNADTIQAEMRTIAANNFGCLMPGEAAITTAGNLPHCKKIVHAVGPRWNDASERDKNPNLVLQSSIRRCLEETENAGLHSLAIPAISCGVYGGIPNVCVPLILDTVKDYFNDNKSSCIKQVDFVERDKQDVLTEFKKGVLKLGTPIKTKKQHHQQSTTLISSNILSSFLKLVQGDIAQQNADVIVNIMAEGHVRDMSRGSAISQAIAAAAGQTVVNECAQFHGKYGAGHVFKTSSGSMQCREIYHGLLRNYDQNSEKTVKKMVMRCLQMADQGRFQSIAFPAIGTGGFSFPPQDVARWMKDAISRFNGNNLSTVFIVLHPSNAAVVNAFQVEFTASVPPPTAASAATPAPAPNLALPSSVTYGPLTVSVIQGDITQQNCDAIVNSTNAKFDLSMGLVSTKIIKQGGDSIQDELDKATGDFAVSSGGNLPCKNIIHMVTPDDSKDLQKKIVNLLQLADSNSFSSVAIPALGTGKLSMDSSTVGLYMRAAIEAFVKLNPRTRALNRVDVVIFDVNKLQPFKEAILGDRTAKKGAFEKIVQGVKEWFYPSSKEEKVMETLDLYLYAARKQEINQTLKCIENETKKMMHRETIEDPILDRLTAMENFEIKEIEKKNDVKIDYRSGRYLKHLVLVGLTKNVVKACDAIRTVLREFSEAETFVQYIAWENVASNGVWVELPARAAHTLEKVYQEKKGNILTEVQVMEFRFDKIAPATYDLSTLGNDPNGTNPPKIRRRPKEQGKSEDALPSDWEDMNGALLKRVQLQPGSTEYQKVLTNLRQTGLQPQNPMIERIQSVSLYKQYSAKKAEVTKKLQGTNCQIEMELYHGTTNADKIISNGFDRSFAGANAAVYGNGVYFATQASYSHGYTRPGANRMRTVFLAKVITGAFAQGSGGLKTPPIKSGLELYDSVVDNVNAPTMFIIFKDASAYPTYLIQYP